MATPRQAAAAAAAAAARECGSPHAKKRVSSSLSPAKAGGDARKDKKKSVNWDDVEAKAKREAMWLLQWRKQQQETQANPVPWQTSPSKKRQRKSPPKKQREHKGESETAANADDDTSKRQPQTPEPNQMTPSPPTPPPPMSTIDGRLPAPIATVRELELSPVRDTVKVELGTGADLAPSPAALGYVDAGVGMDAPLETEAVRTGAAEIGANLKDAEMGMNAALETEVVRAGAAEIGKSPKKTRVGMDAAPETEAVPTGAAKIGADPEKAEVGMNSAPEMEAVQTGAADIGARPENAEIGMDAALETDAVRTGAAEIRASLKDAEMGMEMALETESVRAGAADIGAGPRNTEIGTDAAPETEVVRAGAAEIGKSPKKAGVGMDAALETEAVRTGAAEIGACLENAEVGMDAAPEVEAVQTRAAEIGVGLENVGVGMDAALETEAVQTGAADIGARPENAEVGMDAAPEMEAVRTGAAEIRADLENADFGMDAAPEMEAVRTGAAEIGAGPENAGVGMDAAPEVEAVRTGVTEIGAGPENAEVGMNAAPEMEAVRTGAAEIGVGPENAEVGMDAAPEMEMETEQTEAAEIGVGPENAEVGMDAAPEMEMETERTGAAEIGAGPKKVGVDAASEMETKRTGAAEIGVGPENAEVGMDAASEVEAVQTRAAEIGVGLENAGVGMFAASEVEAVRTGVAEIRAGPKEVAEKGRNVGSVRDDDTHQPDGCREQRQQSLCLSASRSALCSATSSAFSCVYPPSLSLPSPSHSYSSGSDGTALSTCAPTSATSTSSPVMPLSPVQSQTAGGEKQVRVSADAAVSVITADASTAPSVMPSLAPFDGASIWSGGQGMSILAAAAVGRALEEARQGQDCVKSPRRSGYSDGGNGDDGHDDGGDGNGDALVPSPWPATPGPVAKALQGPKIRTKKRKAASGSKGRKSASAAAAAASSKSTASFKSAAQSTGVDTSESDGGGSWIPPATRDSPTKSRWRPRELHLIVRKPSNRADPSNSGMTNSRTGDSREAFRPAQHANGIGGTSTGGIRPTIPLLPGFSLALASGHDNRVSGGSGWSGGGGGGGGGGYGGRSASLSNATWDMGYGLTAGLAASSPAFSYPTTHGIHGQSGSSGGGWYQGVDRNNGNGAPVRPRGSDERQPPFCSGVSSFFSSAQVTNAYVARDGGYALGIAEPRLPDAPPPVDAGLTACPAAVAATLGHCYFPPPEEEEGGAARAAPLPVASAKAFRRDPMDLEKEDGNGPGGKLHNANDNYGYQAAGINEAAAAAEDDDDHDYGHQNQHQHYQAGYPNGSTAVEAAVGWTEGPFSLRCLPAEALAALQEAGAAGGMDTDLLEAAVVATGEGPSEKPCDDFIVTTVKDGKGRRATTTVQVKRKKKKRRRTVRPKRETHVLVSESEGEEPGGTSATWRGLEEAAREEAKALLLARNSGMMEAENDDNQHWVRRSVRAAGASQVDSPHVVKLLAQIRSNDPEVEVLKLHHYLGPDVNTAVIDAVLEAISVNTNCQALYIQNFNEGFREEQVAKLASVLRQGRIWCLNAGENYKVGLETWWNFVEEIKSTNVTHAYLSEHVITPDLKNAMRDAIRENRRKHTRHKNASNLSVIRRCTNMWWNPINSKFLQAELTEMDIDYEGLVHCAPSPVASSKRVPCSLHGNGEGKSLPPPLDLSASPSLARGGQRGMVACTSSANKAP